MLNDRFAKIALQGMRRSRDETVRARNAAERTIIVMADENRRALERKTAAGTAKEAVREAAMGNDPPISPILREALRGADTVSGVK